MNPMIPRKAKAPAGLPEAFAQYRAMRAEIDVISRRLRAGVTVTDQVRGSRTQYPYTEHTVHIEGRDFAREQLLRRRMEALRKTCDEVENQIDALPDARMRVILTLRYMDGETWERVGEKLDISEDAARKHAARFWKKQEAG